MILTKSGFRDAPPTRKPSISGFFPNSAALSAVTEPVCRMYFVIRKISVTSIDDSRRGSYLLGDLLLEELANPVVDLLSLFRRGGLACTDGPDWLVGDDDVVPLDALVDDSLQLAEVHLKPIFLVQSYINKYFIVKKYLLGLSSLAFLEKLSDAEDDLQTILQGMNSLVGDQL